MDVGRRLARRADDRLRSARGHLRGAARGRQGPGDHERARVRLASALFARRQDDRLHERPQRHRERLAHGRRRQEPGSAHDREGLLRAQRRLDARRQLPDRAQGRGQARRHPARGALDLPSRGRRRHQADLFRRRQQRGRRRGLEGRQVHLLRGPRAQVQLHPEPGRRPLADLPLRPRARRELPGHGRIRRRRAARPLARRQDARLHLAPRRRHRHGRPRSRLGLGARPRARGDARRGRGLRPDGPVAQLRLHARRQGARLLERGQALAHGRREPEPSRRSRSRRPSSSSSRRA